MKKNYKKMMSILCLGLIGVSAYAQGTWKAAGTEATVAPGTEMTYVGIYGLSVMHSEAAAAGVIGKSDVGSPTVSYNGIDWDNPAIIQGATNVMYYTLTPTSNGTLDISVKMGSGKNTFVFELTDAFTSSYANLAALITANPVATTIIATAADFTTPTVTNSVDNSTATWNGTAAINTTGANVYQVLSFTVKANKTYVVGVVGSKLMVRGINYILAPAGVVSANADKKIFNIQNPAKGNVTFQMNESVQVGIFNTVGVLVSQKLVSPSENKVDISRLVPGVYFIKDMNNAYKTQKLIVE